MYVEDTTAPIVTPGGIPPSLVCIVGPARGYQTASETLALYQDQAATLRNQGVITTDQAGPPAVSAPRVTKLDGTLLQVETDYVLTTSSGEGGEGTSTTSIQRVATSTAVGEGEMVVVEYNYTNSTYYSPQVFDDFDRVMAMYGRPLVQQTPGSPSDTHVNSPLSLGIQLAFQNGAAEVIGVATNPSDGDIKAQITSAYQKVRSNYSAAIIVPVFPDDITVTAGTVTGLVQTMAQDLRAHCNTASAEGYNRIGIFGLPKNYSETELSVDSLALSVASKRVVLTYPAALQLYNPSVQQSTEVAGCYLAAALAGILSSLPVNTGLTRQVVSGFQGIDSAKRQDMTNSAMNQLSSNGVLVVQIDRLGRLLVRHGVTTDNSALNTREVSLVRIGDAVHQTVQGSLENSNLIGSPIDADMVIRIQGVIQGALEQMRISNTIVSWTGLSVQQQSVDPSVVEARFAYRPAVPLNYIVVSYTVDLNTGEISETTPA